MIWRTLDSRSSKTRVLPTNSRENREGPAVCLETRTKFKRLREKIPGTYEKSILKERLFHGMHQDLQDSIRFCYKKTEMTYNELLNEMLYAEQEKFTEVKSTSLKIKSAVATSEDGGIKDLQQKIDQLTTVIKSSTFAGSKPKKENAAITNVANGQYTGKNKIKKPTSYTCLL